METLKNPNLETTHNHVTLSSPSSSQDFKKTHHQCHHARPVSHKIHEDEGHLTFKSHKEPSNACEVIKKTASPSCSPAVAGKGDCTSPPPEVVPEESVLERLKRHRVEIAGRVWIPDIWGHEDLLKDWIDCTVFDSSLGNNRIMSARTALVQEGRSTLRIQNQC